MVRGRDCQAGGWAGRLSARAPLGAGRRCTTARTWTARWCAARLPVDGNSRGARRRPPPDQAAPGGRGTPGGGAVAGQIGAWRRPTVAEHPAAGPPPARSELGVDQQSRNSGAGAAAGQIGAWRRPTVAEQRRRGRRRPSSRGATARRRQVARSQETLSSGAGRAWRARNTRRRGRRRVDRSLASTLSRGTPAPRPPLASSSRGVDPRSRHRTRPSVQHRPATRLRRAPDSGQSASASSRSWVSWVHSTRKASWPLFDRISRYRASTPAAPAASTSSRTCRGP